MVLAEPGHQRLWRSVRIQPGARRHAGARVDQERATRHRPGYHPHSARNCQVRDARVTAQSRNVPF